MRVVSPARPSTLQVRREREDVRGPPRSLQAIGDFSHKRHERGTTGDSPFKGTKGVQLAIARSKASSV